MMWGGVPMAAAMLTQVRLKSCITHSLTPEALSRRAFDFDQPLKVRSRPTRDCEKAQRDFNQERGRRQHRAVYCSSEGIPLGPDAGVDRRALRFGLHPLPDPSTGTVVHNGKRPFSVSFPNRENRGSDSCGDEDHAEQLSLLGQGLDQYEWRVAAPPDRDALQLCQAVHSILRKRDSLLNGPISNQIYGSF